MHTGFLWVLIEKFGAAFLSVAVFFVYAKFLSTEEMGIAVVILSITQFLALLLNSFFEDALVQKEKYTESDMNSSFWISMIISVLLMILTCMGFYIWGKSVPHHSILAMAAFGSLEILFTNMTTTYVAKLRREGKFKILAFRVIVGRITGAMIGLSCILSGLGAWSIIAQSVTGMAFQLFTLLYASRRIPSFEIHISLLKETSRFGSMMTIRRLSWDALVRMTPIAANIVGGPSLAGIVGFAWRIVELIRGSISSGLAGYLLPILSKDKNNIPKMAADFINITGVTAFFSTPVFLGLYLVAPTMIKEFFDEKWYNTAPLIQIFSIAALISIYRTPAVVSINAAGFPGKMLVPDIVASTLTITMMLLFGHLGSWVIGLAYLGFMTFLLPKSISIVKNILNLSAFEQIRPILHFSLPGYIMFIVLFLLHTDIDNLGYSPLITLLIYMSLGGFIFAIAALAFNKDHLIKWSKNFHTKNKMG